MTITVTVSDTDSTPVEVVKASLFKLADAFASIDTAVEIEDGDPQCYIAGNEVVLRGGVLIDGDLTGAPAVGQLRDDLLPASLDVQARYVHYDGNLVNVILGGLDGGAVQITRLDGGTIPAGGSGKTGFLLDARYLLKSATA